MTQKEFQVGELIENRYRVLSVIGIGGMGVLYRVSDTVQQDEIVALKMVRLKRSAAEMPDHVARFQREFQILTELRHPNLVSVYDYGVTSEGGLYFTMEWIEGTYLEPRGSLREPATIFSVIVQICRALTYLHTRGVIHGDLKPANVLLTPNNQVKILDFGVSLEIRSAEARARYYTAGYSAPEVKT
ncbi:MAG: serine/threonine protein kinase [Chloroflexi bacterium]|nr:serine/threonine protein kinase [Chloroflexota bacterium]